MAEALSGALVTVAPPPPTVWSDRPGEGIAAMATGCCCRGNRPARRRCQRSVAAERIPYSYLVTLRLHDTASRSVREFTPITPGQASVYLCGATVQAPPHIGHLRSAYASTSGPLAGGTGYQVTFCRNVTDVEDKILRTASGRPRAAIVAERNQRAFTWAYDASDAVRLISSRAPPGTSGDDRADPAPDRAGQRLPRRRRRVFRRALLRRLRCAFRPAARSDAGRGRRQRQRSQTRPRDFTLWKPRSRASPAGRPRGVLAGRLHLECSAMATKYSDRPLTFTRRMDLIFPHHENELANPAPPRRFARTAAQRPAQAGRGEMSKSGALAARHRRADPSGPPSCGIPRPGALRSLLEFPRMRWMRRPRVPADRALRGAGTEVLGRLGIDYSTDAAGERDGREQGSLPRCGVVPFGHGRRLGRSVRAGGRARCVRTATRRWPPRTRPAPGPAWSGSGRCLACSASIRSRPWAGANGGQVTGSARWSTHWSS